MIFENFCLPKKKWYTDHFGAYVYTFETLLLSVCACFFIVFFPVKMAHNLCAFVQQRKHILVLFHAAHSFFPSFLARISQRQEHT